jgi:hypothetical protein
MGGDKGGGQGGGGGKRRRRSIAGEPTVKIGLVLLAFEHAEYCVANRGAAASGEFGGEGGRIWKSG